MDEVRIPEGANFLKLIGLNQTMMRLFNNMMDRTEKVSENISLTQKIFSFKI
jgi:hypothetical protein